MMIEGIISVYDRAYHRLGAGLETHIISTTVLFLWRIRGLVGDCEARHVAANRTAVSSNAELG